MGTAATDNLKKDYFWNTVGSGVYALASMVLAFAVMHIAGPDDGGIFGFGFSAFGQQMFIIAYFGIRPFHITDVSREYSYEEYRKLRMLTAFGAVAAAAAYLVLMQLLDRYSARKAAIIFLLALYKTADGIADLYESECQRSGVLWLGGRELTFRTLLSAGMLIASLLLTGDVLKASAAAVCVQAAYILYFRGYIRTHVPGLSEDAPGAQHLSQDAAGAQGFAGAERSDGAASSGKGIASLARNTVLLFLSVFVDFYVFSASKYAIDMHLTDADSGIFNVLFMPTSVIYLAANFIIRPYMTRLSALYEQRDMKAFKSVAGRLRTGVLLLSAAALAGTALLGKPVLGILELMLGTQYSGMLTSRAGAFFLIILGGCFYALTNLYYYILIIMRRQKKIFVNYLIAAAAAAVLSNLAVPRFGLSGAAAVYPVYMGLTTLLFAVTSSSLYESSH